MHKMTTFKYYFAEDFYIPEAIPGAKVTVSKLEPGTQVYSA